jgi:hypothetical protein
MAITSSFVTRWENTKLFFGNNFTENNRFKFQPGFNSDANVFIVDSINDKILLKTAGVYHLEFNAFIVYMHDKVIEKQPQLELRLFNGTQSIGAFFNELMDLETTLGNTKSLFLKSIYFSRDMHFDANTELTFRIGITSNPSPADLSKIDFHLVPGGVLAGHLW